MDKILLLPSFLLLLFQLQTPMMARAISPCSGEKAALGLTIRNDHRFAPSSEPMLFWLSQIQDHTELHWELEELTDEQAFELEYSINGIDFESFALLPAHGKHYAYTDPEMRMGEVAYYRIKTWRQSGTAAYSDIKAIRLDRALVPLTLYPNPVQDGLYVRLMLAAATDCRLELRATNGQLVWTSTQSFEAGAHELDLPLHDLPSGWYSFHFYSGSIQLLRRVVKQ